MFYCNNIFFVFAQTMAFYSTDHRLCFYNMHDTLIGCLDDVLQSGTLRANNFAEGSISG